jgi:hypothetical protein
MKLIMQTIPTGTKCKLCEKIDTKMRRRAAEVDRIGRWQREGQKFRASIEKSAELIRGLDSEISPLRREKQCLQSDGNGEVIVSPEEDSDDESSDWGFEVDTEDTGNDNVDFQDIELSSKETRLQDQVFSDSGYRSGQGSDTESICSFNSSQNSIGLPHDVLQDFIAFVGSALLEKCGAKHWAEYVSAHHSVDAIEKQVGSMLKWYTRQLVQATSASGAVNVSFGSNMTSSHQDILAGATKLVQRYRCQIARYFRENVSSARITGTSLDTLLHGLGNPLSLPERLGLSARLAASHEDFTSAACKYPDDDEIMDDVDSEDEEEELLANVEAVRKMLVENDAFCLLALELRRTLYNDDRSEMESIKTVMMEDSLLGPGSGSHQASFSMHWPMADFMRGQYGEDIPRIGSVVVITGATLYAQATTCSEYVVATWPNTGAFFLTLLEAILNKVLSIPGHSQKDLPIALTSDLGLSVQVFLHESRMTFVSDAVEKTSLVELAQQLAWVGSALRTSPFGDELAYSKPLFLRRGPRTFEIMFKHAPIHVSETACWLPLFCGAVIAKGFPIPERGDEVGLEVPLQILAELAGVRHAVEHENGIVMKGFAHMFVPVRRDGDRVQWHAIFSGDTEKRITYAHSLSQCNSRASLDEVSLQDLPSLRAFVGWCAVSESRLGSDLANYENIDYSKTEEADSSPRCTGGSLGFQQFGVAALDFRFGMKDGKCHFQRAGPFLKIIQAAETTPIVLYDSGEKRAWLVPASEVMLHMLQHRHKLSPFEADGKRLTLDTNITASASARDIMLANRSVVLLEDDHHTFRDELLNIWSLLEFLLDQNLTRQRSAAGASVTGTLQETVYGFEFKAVVLERSPFRLKKTKISKSNGGWPQLVRDIDALVLFADGFEDVLVPAAWGNPGLCRRWQRVPREKDYMATSAKMLQQLYDEAGCRLDQTFLTSRSRIQWHQGNSILFDPCRNSKLCSCIRLQQLFSSSAVGTIVPPKQVVHEGAVIFGRSGLHGAPSSHSQMSALPSLYSQPNATLTPVAIDGSEDSEPCDLTHSSTSGSDATTWSTAATLHPHTPASTQSSSLEIPNMNVCPASNSAEVLDGGKEGGHNRFAASIEKSMEMIRGLDSEIYELSCERNRRLQAIH